MNSVETEAVSLLWNDALQQAQQRRRTPAATYRLQMHEEFTLRDALRIVPYLDQLGISHLYVSSLLTARPGSRHGYDVVNHSHLNPELGTEDDLASLVKELHDRGMGLILDVVPNHMWVGEGNDWWMDVLENGPASRYAEYFDIAWRDHPRERLRGKVLLPILGEPYGKILQAGRLRPWFENGGFGITIDQTRLPLDPRTYSVFLEPALRTFRAERPDDDPPVLELQSITTAVKHLPSREDPDVEHLTEARAEGMVIKRRLRELVDRHPRVRAAIEQAILELTEIQDHSDGLTRLVDLLDAQAYRPCFWRVALDEINYRRFFDVNDLAALAAERLDVFHATHVKPLEWLQKGILDGLRVDHVDGLLDPGEYLDRLQRHYLLGFARKKWEAERERFGDLQWTDIEAAFLNGAERPLDPQQYPLYVVIEKILGQRESLPTTWACDGTTGYEFLNEVNGLFVDTRRANDFSRVYESLTGLTDSFEELAREKKLQILRSTMASELHVLAHRLDRLAQSEWWSRDFTWNGLRHALEEIIACFPVYRTYVHYDASPSDRVVILRAARRARAVSPLLGKEILEFICDTLLLRESRNGPVSSEYRDQQRYFSGKFQQLTSPVMAKGVEDTALYIYNRLVSLNEVGGEPARFGRQPQDLHSFLRQRTASFRGGLSPLSTHDTKRSEDVRARLNVLSEMPDEWQRRLEKWQRLNSHFKAEPEEGVLAPDSNEEYLIYQTLLGVWPETDDSGRVRPEFLERIQSYMLKAQREAKVHSSWIHPNLEYEAAVSNFIIGILNFDQSAEFLGDLREFLGLIRPIGMLNSLSQSLIRCTAPGVPDTYQGTESWDYSLVDPDNRRPVDYAARSAILDRQAGLATMDPAGRGELLRHEIRAGGSKLMVVSTALKFRRSHLDLFQTGNYVPLDSDGTDAAHLFGFLMANQETAALVDVPRLIGTLQARGCWFGSELRGELDAGLNLPPEWSQRTWRNLFSDQVMSFPDGRVTAARLFADFPVALLQCVSGS